MKVIFLDIDGVLCCRQPGVIQQPLTQNLKALVERTGARIVLSSDWRRMREGRVEVQRQLAVCGLDFIGCTPLSRSRYVAERPAEILKWMHTYHTRAKKEGLEPVTHFVAIDDRDLPTEFGGIHLRQHFCLTKLRIGLTMERVEACVRVLNGPALPPDFMELVAHANPALITGGRPAYSSRNWVPPKLRVPADTAHPSLHLPRLITPSAGPGPALQAPGLLCGAGPALPRMGPSSPSARPPGSPGVPYVLKRPSPAGMNRFGARY